MNSHQKKIWSEKIGAKKYVLYDAMFMSFKKEKLIQVIVLRIMVTPKEWVLTIMGH